MATLQAIRSKAGILVSIAIGLALLAFILTDLLTSGENVFGGRNQAVAKIEGESISLDKYQKLLDEYEDFQKLNSGEMNEEQTARLRENVWNELVQTIAMGKLYEAAGITVTPEEVFDITAGNNINPTVRQMFTNPQTQIFDKNAVINFLKNKANDPQANFYWSFMEKQLISERLFTKYCALVKKSIYCTDNYAQFEAKANAKEVDFAFVGVPYTTIADSLVKVSDSEISKRYNSNKELYKSEATRDIEYVCFEVKPTEADRIATQEYIAKQKEAFGNPETNAFEYVQKNAENPVGERFVRKDQLAANLQDFVSGAEINDVFGPYLEGEQYKLTRLVAIAQRPDSVKARHILVRNNEKLADSLFARLTSGGDDFAALARRYSEDQGSAINDGDLGWFVDGMMVPEFNEACFNNAKGAIVKIQSQFGTHIINVQDKGVPTTKYSLATIDRTIDYSSKTYQDRFNEASVFAAKCTSAEAFEAAVDTFDIMKRFGRNIKASDYNVGALKQARELVHWVYDAKVGRTSPLFTIGDNFVVAVLTKIQDKGYVPVSEVSTAIAFELRNEKKADELLAAINGKDLAAIAAEYKQTVDTAQNIAFSAYNVPGAGLEPALVGKANVAAKGSVETVKGNNGVYAIQVVDEKSEEAQVSAAKTAYQQMNYGIESQIMRNARNNAEVEDYRIKFF